ncbi:MAG TPA: 4Fe-4S binding protein [Candidatus Hydrogenedentes bacterium]|nr:4Fe-4S binding protein [Candidatus Hydrogenedentota bacterium]HPG68885.1 4Fe-4S binding protein [Candidatus Hydrogenedentota bacterium]
MASKYVIRIDEDACIGCGQCVNACPNGALALVDGKAKLVGEIQCDGLGACIGDCPVGALRTEPREIGAPSEQLAPAMAAEATHACPGRAERRFERSVAESGEARPIGAPSALTHWPVQLHLVNPASPHFQGADVLIAADCCAYAHGGFHADLLEGRRLMIACPKLDNPRGYLEKLTELFAESKPRSVTIARMEVPCCTGLTRLVAQARERAESGVPVHEVVVGIEGNILSERDF